MNETASYTDSTTSDWNISWQPWQPQPQIQVIDEAFKVKISQELEELRKRMGELEKECNRLKELAEKLDRKIGTLLKEDELKCEI